MEELENKLIELLSKSKKNMSQEEIADYLGCEVNDPIIAKTIHDLETQGRIFRNKKNQFLIWHNGLNRIFGNIRITKRGAGILREDDGTVTFIHRDFLNGALPGDKVIVKDLKMVKGRQEGKIEKIVERNKNNVLCEVVNYAGRKVLKPLCDNKELKLKVNREDLKQYVEGDRILIEIGLAKEEDVYLGKIVKKVCHKDDPNTDLITIAAMHGFDIEFPAEVREEVKDIPTNIEEEDLSNRVDLRDKVIFTIDGEDTKDIDDAISLEILPNGNYKLGVHIADVSHYVKPGTALFDEALKRGTSVYMLDSVIPMLPRELSNGICSLNPNEDRLAKTCEMEIDKSGRILKSQVFDSVIRSRKKMSYTKVNEILEDGNIPEGYEEYADILKEMDDIAKKMYRKRITKGAIEFDKPEMKIKTDYKGRPTDILAIRQRSGEQLIESFMLAANESVATKISRRKLPFIYRVHDMPDRMKLSRIIETICHTNNKIVRPRGEISNSRTIQKFLNSLRDLRQYPAFSDMILRGMSKAEYSEENIGHYGLAMKNYTHFTSPIRRFPDLLVHHLINLYQKGNIKDIDLSELQEKIGEIAYLSSESEREAQKAEYDANDMKSAEYMTRYIGEEFEGTITDINPHGMRITLDNLVEGVVNMSDIEPRSYYIFDKSRHCLMCPEGEYHLGDRVDTVVKAATKEYKRVNFSVLGHTKFKKNGEKVKTKEFNCGQK